MSAGSGEPTRFVQTTETHTMQGDDTVHSAYMLLQSLPNGWKLVSLEHRDGWWTAVVRDRRDAVSGPFEK